MDKLVKNYQIKIKEKMIIIERTPRPWMHVLVYQTNSPETNRQFWPFSQASKTKVKKPTSTPYLNK